MTLLDRIQANERCAYASCPHDRLEGALFCGSAGAGHLSDWWAGRLRKLPDGRYYGTVGPRPRFPARDLTPRPAA